MGLIKEGKAALMKKDVKQLKEDGEKKAWVAINQYFDGAGNGPEAKLAVVALGVIAKQEQSKNNSRSLDFALRVYEEKKNLLTK